MEDLNNNRSKVAEFYVNRSIFVTGSSGFMGKVLIEKLLYSCSGLKNIFMLVRPKIGRSVEVRMEEMMKLPMFQRLKQEKPEMLKKLIPVQGDVTIEGLGLSPEMRKRLQDEVSIVFHAAATLRLESNLKDAVEMNTTGTYRVLDICKNMKNLAVFIHLSTAFCHVDKEILEEKVYDSPYDPHDIMRIVKWMDLKSLNTITPKIISPHPNTYTFSKRLAETLVADHFEELPVCIVRPSIVTSAFKEPIPGWVDNLNGPVGICVAAGKGVLRSMYCKAEYTAEVIPVDFAISGIIDIAREVAEAKKEKEIPVYNLTQSKEREVSWGEILEIGRDLCWDYPFDMMLWYPDGNLRNNKLIHNICVFFLHWVPAYFIDFLLFIFRQKRFMIRVQQKISDGLDVLQYFTTHKWTFKNDKFLKLRRNMNEIDKSTFFMDFTVVDTQAYIKECILGARVFCMKEPLENLPRARRTIRILYVLDRLVHFLFYMTIAYWIVSWSETAKYVLDSTGDNLVNVPFVRNFVSRGDMPVPRH